MQKGNNLYPIFLKLENMQVLLVGAGNVGLEKLESLLGHYHCCSAYKNRTEGIY
jgi:hypothetical protein